MPNQAPQTSYGDNLRESRERLVQIAETTATPGWQWIVEDAKTEVEALSDALKTETDHGNLRALQGKIEKCEAIVFLRQYAELLVEQIDETLREEADGESF